eukprot:TRINITY_DN7106_c0_g1_i6.p1 TRINITY_DN7106_c0_g1~~TRINITY_DN7106_c0_g1_i6.p1  ORF type:complete len:259 (-),score=7.79 TRINITY_DN7106_c0_g1_i6:33-809(-)
MQRQSLRHFHTRSRSSLLSNEFHLLRCRDCLHMENCHSALVQSEDGVQPPLICFYVLVHIVFVTDILYFLGGVAICCNNYTYTLVSDYAYVFRRSLLFLSRTVYVYTLNIANKESPYNCLPVFIVIICILDNISYLILNLAFTANFIPQKYVHSYNIFTECFAMLLFTYVAAKLLKLIGRFPELFKKSQWYLFISIVFAYATVKIVFTDLGYISKKKISFALHSAFFNMFTAVIPGAIIIWLMFNSEMENDSQITEEL